MADWKTRVDFTASNLNAAAFPPRDTWLRSVTCPSTNNGVPAAGKRTLMVAELHYEVQGISAVRTRRCFVVSSYIDNNLPTQKPILLAAFPSSSIPGIGDFGGAMPLYDPNHNYSPIDFQWPLAVVRDTGIYAVLIDAPRYGFNSYTPANAYDPIIDAVCGIDAAKWFIGSIPSIWFPNVKTYAATVPPVFSLSPKLILGGLSYGAIMTQFLATVLPDAYAAYMAGAYPVKATEAFSTPSFPPDFYPADWIASGFDYTDALKASSIKRAMIAYGWDNGGAAGALPSDYARVNPSWSTSLIDSACNGLVAFDPTRFEYHIKTTAPVYQGHEFDLSHGVTWISGQVAEVYAGL